jgi:hypothetical protein
MENALGEQRKHLYDSTSRIFRSVYFLMKNNRPFTDLPTLVDLQALNGLDMGLILQSDRTAAEISDFISSQMRSKLCTELITSGTKFAIIIDESTTVAAKSVLILYVRAAICGKVTSLFLDLVELDGGSAEYIANALLKCLDSHGFHDEILQRNLIGLCSDGASVMVGQKSGVLTSLAAKYPRVIRWHCLCHRIELSVGDTLDEVACSNHFKAFMDKLFSLYSLSPKNQRELATCASELDLQLQKIGKIFTVRWVASSYRAVQAVHRNYRALHAHFVSAASDSTRDHTQRQMFRGLADSLASEGFVLNLGLMLDVLEELGNISQEMQRDDITLHRAYGVLNRSIRAIESMKEKPAEHVQEALHGVESLRYREVTVIAQKDGSRKQAAINHNQFLQSLANNLSTRINTTIASNTSARGNSSSESMKNDFLELISQVILTINRKTYFFFSSG